MRIKLFSLSIIFMLVGCNADKLQGEEGKVEASESQEVNTEEQETIAELKLYAEENDVICFDKTLSAAKRANIPEEKYVGIVNSYIERLINDRDIPFLLEHYGKINNIAKADFDNRNKFKDFINNGKTPLLDEMEVAVNSKEFDKVETLYNEPILQDDAEASAMYHYSLYLQTSQNSYEDSVALALAVDSKYSGKLREEIKAGVTDTSYVSATGVTYPGPISDFDWTRIEEWEEIRIKVDEDMAQNKKEGEEEREWAKGQNPSLGMTTGQVEVSLWGKPEKVNRTVNQYGEREQWVYGQGQYLYFTDGILTSFQD